MYHRTFRTVEERRFAALLCDYEKVLTNYMGKSGSNYRTFAKSCRETQITLIMHITVSNKANKDEHYQQTTNMILQLAKDLWLRADDTYKSKPDPKVFDEKVKKKHDLGGFFLMYTMFEKQPIPGKVKIDLGLEDMKAMTKFCEGLSGNIEEEVRFIMQYLMEKEAFNYCIYSDEMRFEEGPRTHLHVSKKSGITKLLHSSDVRDILASSEVYDDLADALKDMNMMKKGVVHDMIRTNGKNPKEEIERQLQTPALKHMMSTGITTGAISALKRLDALLDIPVMTLEGLTKNQDIDMSRRLKMEVQERMERARKKRLHQQAVSSGQYKPKRAYVQPGGIFGRKKDKDEGAAQRRRRQRGVNSTNLVTYLNEGDFNSAIPAHK